jgi:hypothetical protein
MKRSCYLDHGVLRRRACTFLSACALIWPAALYAQHYQQTNLVSDAAVEGTNPHDPNLKIRGASREVLPAHGGYQITGPAFPRFTTELEPKCH